MMVDVHLTDGRTVFRCLSRGQAIALFKRDPGTIDDDAAIGVWARWHPQDDWQKIRLLSVKKHSASFIRKIEPDEREAFLEALPPGERPQVRAA